MPLKEDLLLRAGFEPARYNLNDINTRRFFLFVYVVEIPGLIKSDRVFAHRFQQDPKKDSSCIYNQPRAFWGPAAHHSVCRSFCDDVVHAGKLF